MCWQIRLARWSACARSLNIPYTDAMLQLAAPGAGTPTAYGRLRGTSRSSAPPDSLPRRPRPRCELPDSLQRIADLAQPHYAGAGRAPAPVSRCATTRS